MWGRKEPPSINAGETIRKDENNGKGGAWEGGVKKMKITG